MSATIPNDGPGTDSEFKPDPPERVHLYQVVLLFVYHILLALVLAYAIYNVWPPQPWPGDKAKAADKREGQSTPSSNSNSSSTGGTNSNSQAGSKTSSNANSTVGNRNSAGGSNVNSSVAANTNSNSTSNVQAATNANENNTKSDSAGRSGPGGGGLEAAISPYGEEFPPPFTLFYWKFQPTLETRLILLVLLAGAIGSYVHATSSLVDYLGNRTLVSSWVWWYLLRPFIGMMLALIFYFGFRGGFITGGVNQGGEGAANFINPFGIAALGGLVGMFSKVAADKLNEVFVTLFRPASGQGDAKRGDKLSDSFTPNIGSLSPNTGPTAGGTPVTLTGTGFMTGAVVTFGGAAATAVVVAGPTSITAITPARPAGPVNVEVANTNNQKVTLKDGFTYKD